MKTRDLNGPSSRRIGGSFLAVFSTLLFVVLFLAAGLWFFNPRTGFSAAPHRAKHTYFQSGRWRADARTLVSAVQYLLDPELGGSQTNQVIVQG